MDEATRRRIEEYVRPLSAGLDGVTTYGDIRRIVAACDRIAAGREDLDRDVLYLLAVFSGQEKWVSRMGNASRTELFLSSLGIPVKTVRALLRGLTRFERQPATPEEEIVHDAVRLERMGAYGVARFLAEGHQERSDFSEIARVIEEAAAEPLRTPAGEELARPRRQAMRAFAGQLRKEFEEPGGEGELRQPSEVH
jgi:hypothetical protein